MARHREEQSRWGERRWTWGLKAEEEGNCADDGAGRPEPGTLAGPYAMDAQLLGGERREEHRVQQGPSRRLAALMVGDGWGGQAGKP